MPSLTNTPRFTDEQSRAAGLDTYRRIPSGTTIPIAPSSWKDKTGIFLGEKKKRSPLNIFFNWKNVIICEVDFGDDASFGWEPGATLGCLTRLVFYYSGLQRIHTYILANYYLPTALHFPIFYSDFLLEFSTCKFLNFAKSQTDIHKKMTVINVLYCTWLKIDATFRF